MLAATSVLDVSMASLKSCSFMSSLLSSFFVRFAAEFADKSHIKSDPPQISSKFLESHQRPHPPSHSVFLKKAAFYEAESITSNDYVWGTGRIRLTNALATSFDATKGLARSIPAKTLDDLPKTLPATNHHVMRGYSAPESPQTKNQNPRNYEGIWEQPRRNCDLPINLETIFSIENWFRTKKSFIFNIFIH